MQERIAKAQAIMKQACESLGRQINIMEVCGTHTVSIFRNGIRSALPGGIKLLSGPGCPVCVTDQGYIDITLELAQLDDVILTTYGDMIRVPGKETSLERMHRPNVKVVFSAEDALTLAKTNPDKMVVLVAVGFETTTPPTAVVVDEAQQQGVENFYVLSGHKLVIPAMDALLSGKNNKIDAFLCPGHVSVIIGSDAYKPIVEKYDRPCVVAGFEPLQIIDSIAEICKQLTNGEPKVESMYHAAVTKEGNKTAQRIVAEYFEPYDGYWRGLGKIPGGTLKLKPKFENYDALKRFGIDEICAEQSTGCRCGEVLCGLIEPLDCGLFGAKCTPDEPVGPCMVSSEGACAAWYKYSKRRKSK